MRSSSKARAWASLVRRCRSGRSAIPSAPETPPTCSIRSTSTPGLTLASLSSAARCICGVSRSLWPLLLTLTSSTNLGRAVVDGVVGGVADRVDGMVDLLWGGTLHHLARGDKSPRGLVSLLFLGGLLHALDFVGL